MIFTAHFLFSSISNFNFFPLILDNKRFLLHFLSLFVYLSYYYCLQARSILIAVGPTKASALSTAVPSHLPLQPPPADVAKKPTPLQLSAS
jgi:hypothetical protein